MDFTSLSIKRNAIVWKTISIFSDVRLSLFSVKRKAKVLEMNTIQQCKYYFLFHQSQGYSLRKIYNFLRNRAIYFLQKGKAIVLEILSNSSEVILSLFP